jgi:hypothetical protein
MVPLCIFAMRRVTVPRVPLSLMMAVCWTSKSRILRYMELESISAED